MKEGSFWEYGCQDLWSQRLLNWQLVTLFVIHRLDWGLLVVRVGVELLSVSLTSTVVFLFQGFLWQLFKYTQGNSYLPVPLCFLIWRNPTTRAIVNTVTATHSRRKTFRVSELSERVSSWEDGKMTEMFFAVIILTTQWMEI